MRIVVPCGDGELVVSDLIERAASRYKKATQKGEHCVVQVKYLETVKERARIDNDDLVRDVCDDKDMLTAVYNEILKQKPIVVHRNETDNTEMNKENISTTEAPYTSKQDEESGHYVANALSDNDSGVAADSFGLSSNPDSTHASLNSSSKPPRGLHIDKSLTKKTSFRSSISSNSPSSSPELPRLAFKPNTFARDSNRKSLSTNHPILYKWIDQQEKRSLMVNKQSQEETDSDKSIEHEEIQLDSEAITSVDIKPYTNAEGVEIGLVVQHIVEGSYINCIGELQVADRITEINGISLQGFSNEFSMKVYTEAVKSGTITIKRTRAHSFLKERLKSPELKQLAKELNTYITPKEIVKENVGEVELSTNEAAVEAPTVNTDDLNKKIFTVHLTKGPNGLGFTITSKDVITNKSTSLFVKNILGRGAAITDGRIQAGDELLMVNDVPVSGKIQTEVVKLLRQAEGMVSLQLSRAKGGNVPPPLIKTIVEASPSLKNKSEVTAIKTQVGSSVPKIHDEKPPVKNKQEASPPITNYQEPNLPIKNNHQMSQPINIQADIAPAIKSHMEAITPSKTKVEMSPGIKKTPLNDTIDGPPQPKGYASLTIPLLVQKNAGLGISVKGKIIKETGEEKGIFVKSIMTGTAAEKDGRLCTGDQLMAINDVPLIGISNGNGMSILKNTISKLHGDSTIRITIRRYIHSSDSTGDNSSLRSGSSLSDFSLNKSEVSTPETNHQPKVIAADVNKLFDKMYLMDTPTKPHGINRNKSYFKAVGHVAPNTKLNDLNSKSVSVKTTEIPITQKSKAIFFQPETPPKERGTIVNVQREIGMPLQDDEKENSNNTKRQSYEGECTPHKEKEQTLPINGEDRLNTNKTKDSLPSYEEGRLRLSGKKSEKVSPLPSYEEALSQTKSENGNFNKKINISEAQKLKNYKLFQQSISLDSKPSLSPDTDVDMEYKPQLSAISQSSLESVLDPNKIQFTRDGFGRLSMSEKKGRGHIDATKSRFYNKLKKFKSMEELRVPDGDNFIQNDGGENTMKGASSIDTITSRMDEEEKNASILNRGTVYSSMTPWYTNDEHWNRNAPRTRLRNTSLNESFRSALDRSKSAGKADREHGEEKKKRGFLKGIGILLKRAKKRKEDDHDPVSSPEYITDPTKFPFSQKALLDICEDEKNNNKIVNMNNGQIPGNLNSYELDSSKYLQADRLQRQLVEAKINEMQLERKDKGRKGDNVKNENISKEKDGSTPKQHEQIPGYLSGYHTWQAHDSKHVREKSKEFFYRNITDSQRKVELQRQSSLNLPPKGGEVHRVLPRAPSGPMFKSPDRSHRKTEHTSQGTPNSHGNTNSHGTSNANKPIQIVTVQKNNSDIRNNLHKKHSKESNTRTPKVTTDEQKVTLRKSSHNSKTTEKAVNRRSMPIISDLQQRNSVKISHQAQI